MASVFTSAATFAYRMVTVMTECPRNCWIAGSGTPFMTRWLANVWRKECQPKCGSPALASARASGRRHSCFVNCFPSPSQKTYGPRSWRCWSSASRTALIGMSRGFLLFGLFSVPSQTLRRTWMTPRSRSTCSQRSARISPWRIPVLRARRIIVHHSGSARAPARRRSLCSKVRNLKSAFSSSSSWTLCSLGTRVSNSYSQATLDELRTELATIHENVARKNLPSTEEGRQLARAKAIYEELHPETRHGGKRQRGSSGHSGNLKKAKGFVKATAEATGRSARAISREIKVAEAGATVLQAAVDAGKVNQPLSKRRQPRDVRRCGNPPLLGMWRNPR